MAKASSQHAPLACPTHSPRDPSALPGPPTHPQGHLTCGRDAGCGYQVRSHPPVLQTGKVMLEVLLERGDPGEAVAPFFQLS